MCKNNYKTIKNNYLRTEERQIQQIFSLTLSH